MSIIPKMEILKFRILNLEPSLQYLLNHLFCLKKKKNNKNKINKQIDRLNHSYTKKILIHFYKHF